MSTRRPLAGFLLLSCVLMGLAALAAQWRSRVLAGDGAPGPAAMSPAAPRPTAPGPTASGPAGVGSAKPQVRREGTLLRDEPGRFIVAGNRVAFVASDGTTYIGLENLNLQRLAKVVAASPDPVEWFVSGTLTEFQSSNYLLVSHARRKSAMPKPPRGF